MIDDDEQIIVCFEHVRPDTGTYGSIKAKIGDITRSDLIWERERRAKLFHRVLAETEILVMCNGLHLDYAKIRTDTYKFHRAVEDFLDACDQIDTMLETGVGYTL